MKLKMIIVLTLACVLLLCGCNATNNEPTIIPTIDGLVLNPETPTEKPTETPTETPTEPAIAYPNADLAVDCMEGLIGCATPQEAIAYLTENSQDRAESLLGYYPKDVTVTARLAAPFGEYDIFFYDVNYTESGDVFESGLTIFRRGEDGYKLCLDQEAIQAMRTQFGCTHCGSTGQVTVPGNTACGNCGGTGTWYNPAAYYDGVMNMWMGQYQACGGCGGAGWLSGQSTTTCGNCTGTGLIFS